MRFLTLIVIITMGVIIFYLWNRTIPDGGQTTVVVDTTRTNPVIINNWPATSTVRSQQPQSVNVSGMDSAQLRAMLEDYLQRYKELFIAHNAINKYDTTFKDSTYKETLSMEVYQNRMSRFTRNIEVYHRTTTTIQHPRFSVLGGGFGYSDGSHTAAGFQLSAQTIRGDLYSVGYDMLNKGWYGSIQFKIRLRK